MHAPALVPILVATSRMLRRHALEVAVLGVLGALLGTLAPLLQILAHLPEEPAVVLSLTLACKLPLEGYLFPRFLARADAETCGDPRNPPEGWKAAFEGRWLRAFGARVVLYLVATGGFALMVIPGLVLLAVFGWMPMRVLLRGEGLLSGARSSLALMARSWRVVLRCALTLALLYGALALALGLGLERLLPDPSAWMRLTHPAYWAGQALGSLLDLVLSLGLLALYQAVELPAETLPWDQDSDAR